AAAFCWRASLRGRPPCSGQQPLVRENHGSGQHARPPLLFGGAQLAASTCLPGPLPSRVGSDGAGMGLGWEKKAQSGKKAILSGGWKKDTQNGRMGKEKSGGIW
ncbi:unnamed protein product, partial [Phaeothamnion confervicola]